MSEMRRRHAPTDAPPATRSAPRTVTESPRRGAGPADGSGRYRAGIPPRHSRLFSDRRWTRLKGEGGPMRAAGGRRLPRRPARIGGENRARTSESASECAGGRESSVPTRFPGVSRAHAPDIRRAGVVRVRPGRRHGVKRNLMASVILPGNWTKSSARRRALELKFERGVRLVRQLSLLAIESRVAVRACRVTRANLPKRSRDLGYARNNGNRLARKLSGATTDVRARVRVPRGAGTIL